MVVVFPAPFGPRKPVTMPGRMETDRSLTSMVDPVRRFGSQRQLGIVLREGMCLCLGNRLAPLDQTIAVGARVAPVDAEGRAFPSFDLRERALAQDRDELLAERKLILLVDVALQ